MTTTFSEHIQQLALSDQLPFSIGSISPDFENPVIESVGGFQIPVFNELLTRESWFFEKVTEANVKRQTELRKILRDVAKRFKETFKLEMTLAQVIELMFAPTPEIENNPLYDAFNEENEEAIARYLELARVIQSDVAISWFKITFFMLSRYSGNWDLSNTASLRGSQISAILAFITKEANGGVVPEPVEIVETEEETEGKQLPPAKTGRKSSTTAKV